MIKKFFILFFSLFIILNLFAEEQKKVDLKNNTVDAVSTATPVIITTEKKEKQELIANPDKNVYENKNIFEGVVSKIKFNLKTDYKDDESGNLMTNELGIKAEQTLSNEWRAGVYVRFIKPMSNEDAGVIVKLMQAKFEYVGKFFRIIFGRTDLSKTISTLNFFGPFTTAGQRYLDLVGFTLPIYLKTGVPEIEEVDLPPMAISVYYFPTMLSRAYTTYDGYQEYYLSQLRINANLFNSPTIIIANIGKGTTNYFNYSILSSNISYDINLSFDLFEHFKINVAYGVLNTAFPKETSAIAAGLELHGFNKFIYLINDVIFEMQFPLGGVKGEFEPKDNALFVIARNNFDRFRYFFGIANNVKNDYTFYTIKAKNSEYTEKFGQGNVYAPENLIFENTKGNYLSIYAGVGYEF